MSQKVEFKAGEIFMLTEGSYSDFGNIALFRAMTDLNLKELRNTYLAECKAKEHAYPSATAFAGYLTSLMIAEEVDYTEVWTGEYCDLARGF